MIREKVVCFVNHAAEMGGAEFALARLVAAVDRSEWHPVVVFGEDGPAVDLLREKSVETYVIPLGSGLGKLRRASMGSFAWLGGGRAFAAASYILKLIRFFRERAVELVHTNSMKAHVLGGVAAKLFGVPLVWHLRDSLHPLCLPPMTLKWMRLLARYLPEELVAVSESVAQDSLGPAKAARAHVVYDGIRADCFCVSPAVEMGAAVSSKMWTVGIAGRLCEWKGQHLFLEAAADLVEKGVPVRFELLGGPLFGQEQYADRLKQFVHSSGLAPHVCFQGFVSDVSARIRKWDLLVHASTAPDPCPNVVIEAMAAGVPVVGANSGGVPELLDGGTCGFLFPMGDARALSRCIEGALNNRALRHQISRAAWLRADRCFRAERVAHELSAIWRPLVSGRTYRRRAWPWIEDSPAPTEGGTKTTQGVTSMAQQSSPTTADSA